MAVHPESRDAWARISGKPAEKGSGRRRNEQSIRSLGKEPKKMNRWEKILDDWLGHMAHVGAIEYRQFESVNLRLPGYRTFLKPDFLVLPLTYDLWRASKLDPTFDRRPQFWDVKGYLEEDARLKFNIAASTHTWARFILTVGKPDLSKPFGACPFETVELKPDPRFARRSPNGK